MLRFLSRATFGSKGEVVDAGTDLSNSFVSELVFFGGVLSTFACCTCLFFFEGISSSQFRLSLQVLQRCHHLHFYPPAPVSHKPQAVVLVGYSESVTDTLVKDPNFVVYYVGFHLWLNTSAISIYFPFITSVLHV